MFTGDTPVTGKKWKIPEQITSAGACGQEENEDRE